MNVRFISFYFCLFLIDYLKIVVFRCIKTEVDYNEWDGTPVGDAGRLKTPQDAHRMWVMHAFRQDVVVLACLPFLAHISRKGSTLEL